MINEFLVDPISPNKEWVEIYNPDSVDLRDYWFDDDRSFTDDSGSQSKKPFSSLQTTTAKYIVLEFSSFLNNADGDFVVLFTPDGIEIDYTQYAKSPGKNITIGRYPDGIGDFGIMQTSTKGAPNSEIVLLPTATPTPTPSPTKSPTPTKTPTLTKTPTTVPTKIPTSTKTPTPTTNKTVAETNSDFLNDLASGRDVPTAVLGERTEQISKTPTLMPIGAKETKAKGVREFSSVFIVIGSLLLLGCAILVFFRIEKQKNG